MIIPSHFHNFDPSYRDSDTNPLKHISDCGPLVHCLTRKRRALQPAIIQSSQPRAAMSLQHSHFDKTLEKSLPSSTYLSAGSGVHPSVDSYKTLVPTPPQENSCTPASILRPCHICHRRPVTKDLLEAYTDCDMCGQRACFICLRQCDAVDCRGGEDQAGEARRRDACDNSQLWIDGSLMRSSTSRKVCSSCAVEGITETGMEVVRCLACI
ncbi:hypothetical protein BDV18DRAFT_147047 [Aspergillus unguis]